MTSELRSTRGSKIRAIVADDSALMRESLSRMLGALPGLKVLGTARDGEEAVQLAVSNAPELVILDYRMPGLDGLEAARAIKARLPDAKIVIVSMHDLRGHYEEHGGVDAVLSKLDVANELPQLIERLFSA